MRADGPYDVVLTVNGKRLYVIGKVDLEFSRRDEPPCDVISCSIDVEGLLEPELEEFINNLHR